ncbi:MAG: methyltransferase domain-containing protein [Gemmataceae bacterium]
MKPTEYILGQSAEAARRLDIQDLHFAAASEELLDRLQLQPSDRVVELGCGPGAFTKRILKRLGAQGRLTSVDSAPGLLDQAKSALASFPNFHPVAADVSALGDWLDGADVVCGRAVLHHLPMAEIVVGRLRARVKPGTRIGFMEPDFRAMLARIGHLEATGRTELAPLREWARVINDLYLIRKISPGVGATLGSALSTAGYSKVQTAFFEFPCDQLVIDNMLLFYDEVGETLERLGVITREQIAAQKPLLRAVPPGSPAVWGVHVVTASA